MHPLPCGGTGVGIVRREHDVVHFHQRTIVWQRLVLEHVQRRARDLTRLQRGDQRGFVHDGTAGGVDDDRGRFHLGEGLGIDEVMRLVGFKSQLHADEVGRREK